MGKQLRQQRRGKGGAQYRSPSHRHKAVAKHPEGMGMVGKITDIVHAPGRLCPLAARSKRAPRAIIWVPIHRR